MVAPDRESEGDEEYRLAPVDPPQPAGNLPLGTGNLSQPAGDLPPRAGLLPETTAPRRILGMSQGTYYVVAGLVLAPVFTLTPYLRIVGWVFSAIVHETGHTLFALAVGCPAVPALSLTGHGAATIHGRQYVILALAVWAAIGWLAWCVFRNFPEKWLRSLAIGLAVAYPALAFHSTTRQMGHLLSGHLGELLVAGIFLWRSRTGLFTEEGFERLLYACLGWFLIFRNAYLCFGIAFLPSVYKWYYSSGSFGLTNDYVRAADHVMHVNIKWIVLPMLLLAVATGALSLWLGRKASQSWKGV